MNHKQYGFTIVELLVVIVVIGVLAAITVVSYNGISQRAIVASLQSDLSSASEQFKLYSVEFGSYPTAIAETSAGSGVWCPSLPTANANYCLKLSGGNLKDSYAGTTASFRLVAKNGSNYWAISDNSNPVALTVPVLTSPTSAIIANTSATLGANLVSDGGSAVIATGTCWGASANPTTNCTPIEAGALAALAAPTIATGTGPQFVVISPDGNSAYAANYTSDTISMYSRNTSTGALTALSPATISSGGVGTHPWAITVSPDSTSVYLINSYTSTISMYSRNTGTGLLTALSPATIATDSTPYGITISADGKSVYTSNANLNSISMYSRNTSTGALTALSPALISTSSTPWGIAVSADGTSVYVTNVNSNNMSMYSRNTSTGALTALSPATIATSTYPYDVVVSADGNSVYVSNGSSVSMFSRNSNTGLLTASSPATIASGGSTSYGIAISADDTSVYVVSNNASNISMFRRDKTTGDLTSLASSTIVTGSSPYNVALSPDGTSVYTSNKSANNISMYSRITSLNLGVFTQPRTGFTSNTLFHYRGYATNSIGTGYSPDATFTTLP